MQLGLQYVDRVGRKRHRVRTIGLCTIQIIAQRLGKLHLLHNYAFIIIIKSYQIKFIRFITSFYV